MDAWLLAGAPEWMADPFPEIGQKQIWGEKAQNLGQKSLTAFGVHRNSQCSTACVAFAQALGH